MRFTLEFTVGIWDRHKRT